MYYLKKEKIIKRFMFFEIAFRENIGISDFKVKK